MVIHTQSQRPVLFFTKKIGIPHEDLLVQIWSLFNKHIYWYSDSSFWFKERQYGALEIGFALATKFIAWCTPYIGGKSIISSKTISLNLSRKNLFTKATSSFVDFDFLLQFYHMHYRYFLTFLIDFFICNWQNTWTFGNNFLTMIKKITIY